MNIQKRESDFQASLKKELKRIFPGCIILKNDANQIQGIPDLQIIFGCKYAFLECKRSEHEHIQPNQVYYIKYINDMGGYASFVNPSNKQQIIRELISYLK